MSFKTRIENMYKSADCMFIYKCTNSDCDEEVKMTMKESGLICPVCDSPMKETSKDD